MTNPITVLRDTVPVPMLDACKWERIAGDPHTVNLNAYKSEDGQKIMGTWICTPGKWRVAYDKWNTATSAKAIASSRPTAGIRSI